MPMQATQTMPGTTDGEEGKGGEEGKEDKGRKEEGGHA